MYQHLFKTYWSLPRHHIEVEHRLVEVQANQIYHETSLYYHIKLTIKENVQRLPF